MSIRINQLQLVLYSPGIVIVDKLKIASTINEYVSGLFDGDPVIVPLPEDAPSELPGMHLRSKDERYNFLVARNRIDLFFQPKEDITFPPLGLFETFLSLFQFLQEHVHTQFTRCAMVTTWMMELEKPSGAEYLRANYLRPDAPIKDPDELELHYLTKDTIAGFDVNKWTRMKSARRLSEPGQNTFVIALIDINTLSEKNYTFDRDTLQRFLNESSQVANDTIQTHLKPAEAEHGCTVS
jgi:hypothetical protein